jgi:hypothetical protein
MNDDGKMFTEEAWNAGYATAERLGLTTSWAPGLRPVTKRDVDEIVSAVVNHGFEEIYVDHAVFDDLLGAARQDALESLRQHMKDQLAIEALRSGCVMLTLPRETIGPGEYGMTRLRLIVPVRQLAPVADSPEMAAPLAESLDTSTPWRAMMGRP